MSIAPCVFVYGKSDGCSGEERIIASAGEYCRKNGLAPPSKEIVKTAKGKPCFTAGPDFSVSHSGDYWVCAMSGTAVGIDLQQHTGCDCVKIAKRFFHPDEYSLVNQNPESFWDIWTAKESFVKFLGTGITDEFSGFSVINDKQDFACPGVCFRHLSFKTGYSLCLCARDTDKASFVFYCD